MVSQHSTPSVFLHSSILQTMVPSSWTMSGPSVVSVEFKVVLPESYPDTAPEFELLDLKGMGGGKLTKLSAIVEEAVQFLFFLLFLNILRRWDGPTEKWTHPSDRTVRLFFF